MPILKVGTVCIWQNQVGELAYLNGTECTITKPFEARVMYNQFGERGLHMCYGVDTKVDIFIDPGATFAAESDLRPKTPPISPEAEQEYNELITRINEGVTA